MVRLSVAAAAGFYGIYGHFCERFALYVRRCVLEIISSRSNSEVRLLRQLLRDKGTRDELDCFAAEGDHLCGELADSALEAELFACTRRAEERYPETVSKARRKSSRSVVITDEISEYISDTKSPQGLFLTARKRKTEILPDANRILILDGVQDPGNVGTIIRAAEALSIGGAVLLEGCADIYSPKTLRSSMGSVFRLPCVSAEEKFVRELSERGFTVYGAMLDESARRLGEFAFSGRSAVVIGSEGAGISPSIAALCSEKIFIPIQSAESLNAAVAASIIMWEMKKAP